MSKRLRCSVAEYWESSTIFRDNEVLILKCPGNVLRIDKSTSDYQLRRIARELKSFTSLIARQDGLAICGQYLTYLQSCRQHCCTSDAESSLWYIWGAISTNEQSCSATTKKLLEECYSEYHEFVAECSEEANQYIAALQQKHDRLFITTAKNHNVSIAGVTTPDYFHHLHQYKANNSTKTRSVS